MAFVVAGRRAGVPGTAAGDERPFPTGERKDLPVSGAGGAASPEETGPAEAAVGYRASAIRRAARLAAYWRK